MIQFFIFGFVCFITFTRTLLLFLFLFLSSHFHESSYDIFKKVCHALLFENFQGCQSQGNNLSFCSEYEDEYGQQEEQSTHFSNDYRNE